MRIDLHTHSDRSDGTTSPAEVIQAAGAAGLDVVALTDHDTTVGWEEASRAAERSDIVLVPGLEISTRHQGRSTHLLAYCPDPTYPPLVEMLTAVLAGRDDRLPGVCARLRELGIDITADEVIASAPGAAAFGRPHVADLLVLRGVVGSRTEAFDRFLSQGRPAYVERYAPELVDAIEVVAAAGGVSIVAHPWGRHGQRPDAAGFAELSRTPLAGIEVDHQDHGPARRAVLRGIAEDLGWIVTGSSDFHGAGKVGHELGCNTTTPAELDRLLDAAVRAGAASGRDVPVVSR